MTTPTSDPLLTVLDVLDLETVDADTFATATVAALRPVSEGRVPPEGTDGRAVP